MMILERAKVWLKTLPSRRGWDAARAYGVVAGALVALGGSAALAYNFIFLPATLVSPDLNQAIPDATAKTPQEARDIPGPISGVLFTATESKAWQDRRPLAVVIENHATGARPQCGLSSADAVYEALAEGGITRYLAIYLTSGSDIRLCPIRSLRTYFLDWLSEYDGLAAHVGGNIDALDRIGPEKVKDLDQFGLGAPTYTRGSDRPAPHNVYSTTGSLWEAGAKKGYGGSSTFRSWPFKEEAPLEERSSGQLLRFGFLGEASYKVTWTYDPVTNSYLRSVGGKVDIDRNNNQQISAKTVVVQTIPMTPSRTRINELTILMTTTGSGKAYVFTDGVVKEGTWSKSSRTDRTLFKDTAGVEIPFNRGPIWIEVTPPTSEISF